MATLFLSLSVNLVETLGTGVRAHVSAEPALLKCVGQGVRARFRTECAVI